MRYAYYPGCSLQESAQEFDVSVRAVMGRLGVELEEIPDWTCCGASAAEPVSKLMNYALPARNLAIAEKDMGGVDVLAPCNACYLNLLKVNKEVVGNRRLHGRVNEVLAASGLIYGGTVQVRHLLDVLLNDVGAGIVEQKVTDNLQGMKVAPYYGCQILRPYPVFDDPGKPRSMEPILKALGATVHEWDYGNRCCGASLMMGHRDVAIRSVADILNGAEGADVIVTVCPLCQMNLEAYQGRAVKAGGRFVPVMYLSQLMGVAFGMGEKAMQLGKNMTLTDRMLDELGSKAWRWKDQSAGGDRAGEETMETSKGVHHV
ncbi:MULTISPECIES: CoB--CoM heterodisulfide reductase iron-sulfur subunit B family protein [unclassified Pseudodesulfovibrio]|uniref:CoB--CoM heterodisulfide reductase iron-sulfur subunit B family protein n=1 Tax=unclassified Pseudodesulfovibrio TaxID=2661612 RepID=UPI000FEBA1DA|nr:MULTISPECIES: CoB--CoM heterodisulfide reductase iron-sulfur subunit B family protein [unclassified Pseudodesulfovibrio]MCJ2165261.1 CoB--CoM heterodisulfide reductase iron-sulfur subunit B family protein [Pseudodesulfovibrio sp. S3-i]RWU03312.1 disulfide reductase [Pseudodesulfovibrio sp. S3]